MPEQLAYLVVAVIGGLVGLGELVSRYRDAPLRAGLSVPGLLYIALNTVAAIAALALGRQLGWITLEAGAVPLEWIFVAGFGALAVLRTSVFTVRAGNQDVQLGPSAFLQVILQATDREVDRRRAKARALTVDRVMQGVSFPKAHEALTAYCLALMQNLSQEDQDRLVRDVGPLIESDMDDDAKSRVLGLALMTIVGEDVLEAAVLSLGDKIKG